jgi:small-conductance mechanosensitive channel
MKTKKYSFNLIVSLGFCILFAYLESIGVGLYALNEAYTLAAFLSIVFGIIAFYFASLIATSASVKWRSGSPGEVIMLAGLYRVLTIIALIGSVVYIQGKLSMFASFFSLFGGMLLGWSLQAPVSGLAAWILVTVKRPFRIGDRVQFPTLGLTGDVKQIGPMYTVLDQVGGAIGSEEAVGRNVLIPNAMLFTSVVINYTVKREAAYILDEVVIRITYDSDWDTAEQILLNAARSVTVDIIKETGQEPYIRSDIYDYGIYLRLRYITLATDRPRISHQIIEKIFKAFQHNRNVDFAIPYVYSFKRGLVSSAQTSYQKDDVEHIPIDDIVNADEINPNDSEGLKTVDRLAQSIAEKGLLQPIIVVREPDGNRYKVVAGHQRLKACIHLGWDSVPAIVRNPIGTEIETFEGLASKPFSKEPDQPIPM